MFEQLYLDILEMEKGALKAQSCDGLLNMVHDSKVKELWHKLGTEPTVRLAALLRRFRCFLHLNSRSGCAHACVFCATYFLRYL